MNVVMNDFDTCAKHFESLFEARFLMDLPGKDWHAFLFELGGAIFEVFCPFNFMLNSRHGPHYLGVEYEADIDEARAAVKDHGIRIFREVGGGNMAAFHTDPMDGFGVDYEFYNGSFFDNEPKVLPDPVRSIDYWRDEHPLALNGLIGYTHAVYDLDAASAFLQSFLGAQVVYEADRPALAAKAVGLQVSDDIVELLAPTGDGPLLGEMNLLGEGIRSAVFRASDMDKVKQHFAGRNVELIAGTAPGSLAVPPEANLGILIEFSQ